MLVVLYVPCRDKIFCSRTKYDKTCLQALADSPNFKMLILKFFSINFVFEHSICFPCVCFLLIGFLRQGCSP